MKNEIWKEVSGYVGLYQVSNTGKVRRNGLILKPIENKGYYQISLSKNGISKCFRLHRLIAKAFITKEPGKPCINHKDENKLNNDVSNLEWCNYQYNNTYRNINKRGAENRKGEKNQWFGKTGKEHNRSILVTQYDLEMNKIDEFGSISEASRITGINRNSINMCVNGKRKKAGGYKWK